MSDFFAVSFIKTTLWFHHPAKAGNSKNSVDNTRADAIKENIQSQPSRSGSRPTGDDDSSPAHSVGTGGIEIQMKMD
jgi:hypothetical protein